MRFSYLVTALWLLASPALAQKAWINPSEMEVFDGRLYFTGWVADLALEKEVEFRLTGPGAAGSVTAKARAYAPFGPLSKQGEAICAGVSLDRDDSTGRTRIEHKRDCSFDAKGLKAGGKYQIAALADGRELASSEVLLVEEPMVGGTKTLAVSMESRVGRPYLHPAGLVMWHPVDAQLAREFVTVTWVRDGQISESEAVMIEGPNFLDDAQLRHAVPLVLKNPLLRGHDNHDKLLGEWQVVALLAGERPLFSVKLTVKDGPGGSLSYVGGKVIRRGDYGPLPPGEVPTALLPEIRASAKQRLARYSRDILDRIAYRTEAMVCAVGREQRAHELVRGLAELRHTEIGFADRHEKAGLVLQSRFATEAERAAAQREQTAMVGGEVKVSSAVARLQSELTQLSKKQKRGCLAMLLR